MRFLTIFLTLSSFTIAGAFAQSGYFEDAYRFGRSNPSGSARILGIGGTQWSLGGDISNINGNPAGLGFFRTSEASFSVNYTNWEINTRHLGQINNNSTTDLSLPNFSYVAAKPKNNLEKGKFKGGAFGISIQRIAGFNSEFGFNSSELGETSILDFYNNQALGKNTDELLGSGNAGLMYEAYLLNPFYDQQGNLVVGEYDPVIGYEIAPKQSENIFREGTSSQINFAYGANFNHKLFLGGNFGIRTLNYSSTSNFRESFEEGPLNNLTLNENLFLNGTGVNLNLGLIYKPIDYFNFGIVFQSPTFFTLNEEYSSGVVSNFRSFFYEPEGITLNREEALSDLYVSTLSLRSPMKIGTGATVFFGKYGFVSADADWVDYSKSKFNSRDFSVADINRDIRSFYGSTLNLRFGGEVKINNLRMRGGYAFFGDPYSKSEEIDQSTNQLTGGIGLKINSFNIDFTLVQQKFNGAYRSYPIFDTDNQNIGPISYLENTVTSGILTLGISF